MRILLAHNTYKHAGGEDAVVRNEMELLRSAGHEVRLYSVSNDSIATFADKLRVAVETAYSASSKMAMTDCINDFMPDVMHVHNFFPLLTPSIYAAAGDAGIPVVQTLHNYRLICPGALLLREGRICEKCVRGSSFWGVYHGCYRGSSLGTLPIAYMLEKHRHLGTWAGAVDCYIALTEFARRKYIEGGLPADRIRVKPNFVKDSGGASKGVSSGVSALYVGRLSAEKGIATLLAAWRNLSVPLRIVGDGPCESMVTGAGLPDITYLGRQGAEAVSVEMKRASFMILPSEWYEGFPMVIAEAYSQGLPVVGSRIGGIAEIVRHGETGLLFEPGDPDALAAAVEWMASNPDSVAEMAKAARKDYEEKYTPEQNLGQLLDIYGDVMKARQNRSA